MSALQANAPPFKPSGGGDTPTAVHPAPSFKNKLLGNHQSIHGVGRHHNNNHHHHHHQPLSLMSTGYPYQAGGNYSPIDGTYYNISASMSNTPNASLSASAPPFEMPSGKIPNVSGNVTNNNNNKFVHNNYCLHGALVPTGSGGRPSKGLKGGTPPFVPKSVVNNINTNNNNNNNTNTNTNTNQSVSPIPIVPLHQSPVTSRPNQTANKPPPSYMDTHPHASGAQGSLSGITVTTPPNSAAGSDLASSDNDNTNSPDASRQPPTATDGQAPIAADGNRGQPSAEAAAPETPIAAEPICSDVDSTVTGLPMPPFTFANSKLVVPDIPPPQPQEGALRFHMVWTLYANDHHDPNVYVPTQIRKIGDVKTFWQVMRHSRPISAYVTTRFSYYYFRGDIVPSWEDPRNATGCQVSTVIWEAANEGCDISIIDDSMLLVMMSLSCEGIFKSNEMNGAAFRVRDNRFLLDLWLGTNSHQRIKVICDKMREVISDIYPSIVDQQFSYRETTKTGSSPTTGITGGNTYNNKNNITNINKSKKTQKAKEVIRF